MTLIDDLCRFSCASDLTISEVPKSVLIQEFEENQKLHHLVIFWIEETTKIRELSTPFHAYGYGILIACDRITSGFTSSQTKSFNGNPNIRSNFQKEEFLCEAVYANSQAG